MVCMYPQLNNTTHNNNNNINESNLNNNINQAKDTLLQESIVLSDSVSVLAVSQLKKWQVYSGSHLNFYVLLVRCLWLVFGTTSLTSWMKMFAW